MNYKQFLLLLLLGNAVNAQFNTFGAGRFRGGGRGGENNAGNNDGNDGGNDGGNNNGGNNNGGNDGGNNNGGNNGGNELLLLQDNVQEASQSDGNPDENGQAPSLT